MSKLLSNILYNFIGQSILLVLGFLSVKYVFKLLGEDALGLIYFTATLNVILCGMLEKGLYATTVREIASCYNTGTDYVIDFMRTGTTFCFTIYFLFAVLMYIAAPVLVVKWINLKSMPTGTAVDIIRIFGISSLLAFPRSYYASVFRGLQRMEYNNVIDVVISFLQQTGIIVILLMGRSIYAIAAWFGFCYFLGLITYIISSSFFFPRKALLPGFSLDVLRKIKGFATRTASISVLGTIHKQTDKIVMSKLLPIGMIGYYGFAYGVTAKAGIIVLSIANAAYPSFSKMFKNGNLIGLKKQYFKLQEFISLATIPLFAGVIFAAIPLTTFMFNKDIAQILAMSFMFLSIGFYLNGTLNLLYQLTLAVGRPDIGLQSNFYALFIITPITILLTFYYGITGAAISWVVFNVYLYLYVLPITCKEIFKENLFTWYIRELKFFLLAIVSYGLAWSVFMIYRNYCLTNFSAAYLAGTAVYLSIAVFLTGADLRRSVLSYFRKMLGEANA